MTIEHETTHGPHRPGQLAGDWMLESGIPGEAVAGSRERAAGQNRLRLAVPHPDMSLTLESAAALRDALTEHLENMGSPTEALSTAGFRAIGTPRDSRGRIRPEPPVEAVKVAESIRDAYAENSRTIDGPATAGMTDEEARDVMASLTIWPHTGGGEDRHGIYYTASAVRELKVKAGRPALPAVPAEAWDRLSSPVGPGVSEFIRSPEVRSWTDAQCEGAWNHAMETHPGLTDRPSGRVYTVLAARKLRERLNAINAAPAD